MNLKSSRGVQQHEVDGAADTLLAESKRPTVERIREKLGRGSPNTIGPMLETWFSSLAPRLGVREGEGEACDGPTIARRMADELWQAALSFATQQAERALDLERTELAKQLVSLQAERDDMAAERLRHAARAEAAHEALSLTKSQLEEAASRVKLLEVQIAQSHVEATSLRQKVDQVLVERDAARQRYDDELKVLNSDREKMLERGAANERRLLEEVDRARQETKALRKDLADEARAHKVDLERLDVANRTLQEQADRLRMECITVSERLAASERRATEFQELLASLQSNTQAVRSASPKSRGPRRTRSTGGRTVKPAGDFA